MIDTTLVRERIKPGQFPDQNLVLVYYKALDAMYSVNMSIEYYLLTDDNTRRIVNLNKNAVGSSRGQNPDTHGLLEGRNPEEISRRLLESAANTPSKQLLISQHTG